MIRCKAAVCWAPGKPLTVEQIEVQPPKIGEVRVRLISSAICHGDVTGFNGTMQIKYPCVLGHEGAGVVESVGESVKSIDSGDCVLLLAIGQCYECLSCKRKDTNSCLKHSSAEDQTCDGTPRFRAKNQTLHQFFGVSSFSEYTVVNEARVAKINPKAKMDKVCLFACGFPTGYGAAVNVANVNSKSTVGVWGLGTVGLSAVYGSHKSGASLIIGIDTNEAKKEIALKFGCHYFINPFKCKEENTTVEEIIKKLTNGLGLDIAIECVRGGDIVEEAVKCTAPWGLIIVVGYTEQQNINTRISTNILFPGRQLKASVLGGYKTKEQIPCLVDKYIDGELEINPLITGNVKLDDINMAFEWLTQGKSLRTIILF